MPAKFKLGVGPGWPKVMLILVSVLLVMALVIGLMIGLAFTIVPIPFNPDTQSYCSAPWKGGGQFPDVPGDSVNVGEIFSRDKTYLSWLPEGTGIPFSVAGIIAPSCGSIGLTPRYLRETFTINTGSGYVSFRQDDVPEGAITFDCGASGTCSGNVATPPREIQIDGTTYGDASGGQHGIPDGSVLRVDLEMGFEKSPFDPGINWYGPMARDEIQLLSGVPNLNWEADLYGIGETAKVHWTIPFVAMDGTPAYYLTLTNMNTGSPLAAWNQKALAATTGIASFTVTPDMFAFNGINRIRAEIYSQVFRAGISDTATIDDPDKAPTVTSVSFNLPEFREGDLAIVTITAVPNAGTQSPIAKYYVLAAIGGDVLYDAFSSSNVVSFVASRTGILDVEASAIDEQGRSSAVYRAQATVGNVIVDCEAFPDLPKCKATDSVSLIIAVALVIAVLLVAVIVANSAPDQYKLIAVAAVLVLGFLALWLFGFLEPIFSALGGG